MPEVVGPYRVVSQIGHGGMAVVYLARQPVLGRSVALKELAPFSSRDPALAQRFIREARVAGSLNHPNVVTVFDFLEHDGVPYIAMEYLERGSLRPFVGRMSVAQVAGVLEGLLAALSHAEATGIVHRDVKPENLLITADGGIKIADFGIAKAYQQVATEEMLTPAGATVGTPAYMAPEQAMGEEIGPWTDLYQSGVVAYELLAGKVPFHADGAPVAVMMKHITELVPPLPAGTDPALEAWVMRMLAKAPGERPPNARAAWNDLEEIVLGQVGPLWRREARLGEHEPTVEHPTPLTPARFSSWQDYIPGATRTPPPPPPEPAGRPEVSPPGEASQPVAPGDVAATPSAEPETPAVEPETPAVEPEWPAVEPESPAAEPEAAVVEPEWPAAEPESAVVEPESAAAEPEAAVVEPESAAAEPESPVVEPEWPAVEPETATKPETPAAEPETPAAEPSRGEDAADDPLTDYVDYVPAWPPVRPPESPPGAPAGPPAQRGGAEPTGDPPPPATSFQPNTPASVSPPRPELHARTEAPISPPPPETPRSRARPLVVLALAALVLGLLAAGALLIFTGDDDDPTPTPTPTATATTTATAEPPAGPFPVGDGPDGVAVGAGAVWAAASRGGTLTRIDPASGETTSVEVGENPDSVIVAFDSVWVTVTGENKVVRLTADAQPEVIDEFDVGAQPEGLAASTLAIWVTNAGDGTLSQIVEATGDVRTVEGVGGQLVDLAVGAGAVWVADASRGTVARVDGGRRQLADTIGGIGPNPRAVAILGRDVWVATADDGRAWRIDADANRVTGSVRVGGTPRDIATDGSRLWVTDRERDRVVEIDPEAMQVVRREAVQDGPLSIAVDERDLWVTRFDGGDVARLLAR